jgi:hypothetical protein
MVTQRMTKEAVKSLGMFSIQSGVAILVAPRQMARVYALPPRPGLMRLLGVRDIVLGLALLGPRARGALKARALADCCDLALISSEAISKTGTTRSVRGRLLGGLLLVAAACALARLPAPNWRAAAPR